MACEMIRKRKKQAYSENELYKETSYIHFVHSSLVRNPIYFLYRLEFSSRTGIPQHCQVSLTEDSLFNQTKGVFIRTPKFVYNYKAVI